MQFETNDTHEKMQDERAATVFFTDFHVYQNFHREKELPFLTPDANPFPLHSLCHFA
jgi:hypothetical protein